MVPSMSSRASLFVPEDDPGSEVINLRALSRQQMIDLIKLRDEGLRRDDADRCEKNLYSFVQSAWPWVDPSPFVGGWHIEALCQHLEAITYGRLRDTIFNIPPRTSKSSIVSVCWPAWIWAQPYDKRYRLAGPQVQILSSSYAQNLSRRDAVKARRLIQSPWYQKNWGKRFRLTGDQNEKLRYENDRGGYRLATSVDGQNTGEGGDIIIIDDPNSAKELSEQVLTTTNEWWDEVMSSRLNDPTTGAYVIMMQRLHMLDLTGHRLRQMEESIAAGENDNVTHVCLPMRFEADRRCTTVLGWSDPRTKEGELLCPARLPEHAVRVLERKMGPTIAAGQLQQRPEPKGGNIIKEAYWQLWNKQAAILNGVEYEPRLKFPFFSRKIASLDTSYTEDEENDYSALTVWGTWHGRSRDEDFMTGTRLDRGGRRLDADDEFTRGGGWGDQRAGIDQVMLTYAWRERCELNRLVRAVGTLCARLKVDLLLIEDKAAGHSVAQELRRLFTVGRTWGIRLFNPRKYGDKVNRGWAVQPFFAEGMVWAPNTKWAQEVIDECKVVPRGDHDDYYDTVTQAILYLRKTGLIIRDEERQEVEETDRKYRPNVQPLYPA
jgi:predicted phage terminase large subunit-like protein